MWLTAVTNEVRRLSGGATVDCPVLVSRTPPQPVRPPVSQVGPDPALGTSSREPLAGHIRRTTTGQCRRATAAHASHCRWAERHPYRRGRQVHRHQWGTGDRNHEYTSRRIGRAVAERVPAGYASPAVRGRLVRVQCPVLSSAPELRSALDSCAVTLRAAGAAAFGTAPELLPAHGSAAGRRGGRIPRAWRSPALGRGLAGRCQAADVRRLSRPQRVAEDIADQPDTRTVR